MQEFWKWLTSFYEPFYEWIISLYESWKILFQEAPFGGVTYGHWILEGMLVTASLFVCAWVIAFVVGSIFGVLRTVPNRFLAGLGTLYVAVFRNIPLIVQFFFWNLVVPKLLPGNLGHWFNSSLDTHLQFFILSVLCLGLFTGARVCEQVRSGIAALSDSQFYAGLALGLTLPQTYVHVVMPNAYRVILPPLTSEMLNMVKNTAVASTIGLLELTAQAQRMLDFSAHAYVSFISVTAGYILLNFLVMKGMQYIERAVRFPGFGLGGQNA